MATIVWDQPGERAYETGVDRGVLYVSNSVGVAWNGLTAVTETTTGQEETPLYFDGVKFARTKSPGDFSATVKAYTYPDEFLVCEGILSGGNGLYLTNQTPTTFSLSYRTLVGNDIDSSAGYKIHIVYNATATVSPKNYTFGDTGTATEFEWTITTIPEVVDGFRPTAHVVFDSRRTNPILLADIESTLYGDGVTAPEVPPISTLVNFIGGWVVIRITDNLDGTWTAEGPDNLISMLDANSFQILQANAVQLSPTTYAISDLTY
jgi:hypothetical protein